MIERTKAGFRALRDLTGLTVDDLAAALGVDPRSVRRWEAPGDDAYAPSEEAWELLERARSVQLAMVDGALDRVEPALDAGDAVHVQLGLWRSQADYDAAGRDAGSYRAANANVLAAAAALDAAGADVELGWAGRDDLPWWELARLAR